MPKVTFSKENFLGKTPVEPGWFKLSIGDFTEALSRDKESTNFWGEFKVVEGPRVGLELRHCFSEKGLDMPGGACDFIMCFAKNAVDTVAGQDVLEMLKKTVGRTVLGYVEWDPDFRRNQIRDWRPDNK